ncbi:MAG: hypothetical protein M3340_10320 [Actinomycetota bacterium]|nr:hypothetical protein [Actinomycetota bacterium]
MTWSNLASLLRTILYGWTVSLWRLLRWLHGKIHREPAGEHDHRPPARSDCVPIDHPAFVRPDPLLYSQRYLLDRGLAVTWDNPDITLFKAGVPVSSSELEPATTYDVNVRVWNNSLEAPVVGMPVRLSFLDFGVGTEPIPIASATVDVGVKGSPGQPGFVSVPWTTPATPGHYCLQALLDPADDVDRSNNIGQENTNVVEAQSPATFTFTLRNNTKRERTYRFETDAYEVPERPPCDGEAPDPKSLLDRHRRGRHPVPGGFDVRIDPATPTLPPGAAVTITVTVDPPAEFNGRQGINVNAFHGQGFAGGVTLTTVKAP